MEEVGVGVEPWNAVPRTRHEAEELRAREKEVENLWEEEQEQSLGKVSLNADDRKGHAGEVTEGIPRESSSWVPSHNVSLELWSRRFIKSYQL